MKRQIAFAVAFLLVIAGVATIPQQSEIAEAAGPADASVMEWDTVAVQALGAAGLSAPDAHAAFGWVGVAIYDSVIAIKGGYEPFAVKERASSGASAEAAVASAAYRTLSRLLPAQDAAILSPAYTKSLAAIPNGASKDEGVAVGERVADKLFLLRASEGHQQYVYKAPSPSLPGAWLLTGPAPALGQALFGMQPFALESADQFRPDGPPALGSKEWASEYNEVKEIGGRTSSKRTAAQTLAARFWAEAPVPQAHGSFRRFISDNQLDVVDAARFLGMMTVTYADAIIACFDAKYQYAFWRPVTAIQAGAADGNDLTAADAAWQPLLPGTPNHPDYPSAHSCITPASAYVLAEFLGTERIRFTIPSVSGLGDRYYETAADLTREVGEARIWGGIHFRSAVTDGTEIGRKTADYILSHHFRKVVN